jgi:hypothetical protein
MSYAPEVLLSRLPAALFSAVYVASARGLIERALALHELRGAPRGTARELIDGRVVRLIGRIEVDEGTPLLDPLRDGFVLVSNLPGTLR